MVTPRSGAVRFAAAGAAVALALGLPVLIALSAVVDEPWRPLVSTLLILFTAVPLAAWFLTRRRPSSEPDPEMPSDG